MADSGWLDCSEYESNNGWFNPQYMHGSDGNSALGFDGDDVKQYAFGFSIPSGATIDGIEVRAELETFSGSSSLDLDLYYNSRATAAPTTKNVVAPASMDWVATGGSTDLWGRASWADTDFTDANFAIKVTSYADTIVDVDALQAKVYYTVSVGWGHKINGIANANIGKVNGVSKANIGKINGV